MENKSLLNFNSKGRLEEYKYRVEMIVTRPSKLSFDSRKNSFQFFKHDDSYSVKAKEDIPCKLPSSYNFSQRRTFDEYRAAAGLGKRSDSAILFQGNKSQWEATSVGEKKSNTRMINEPFIRRASEFSPVNRNPRSKELLEKGLSEVIPIGNLNKAIGLIEKGGLDKLPLGYVRQLEQFCSEVLNLGS